MAHEYTDNNGTTFVNPNHCRSFNFSLSNSLTRLTDEVCSEVVLINKTGQNVLVYDSNYFDSSNSLLLGNGESFVLRGVTNANQISAIGVLALSAGGDFYYRTQWYSNSPSR
jgi:hypothetical protein